jgi:hypothetical protein
MVITLGGTAAVYRITRRTAEEVAEADIVSELESAARSIVAQTTRQYIFDRQYATFLRETGVVSQVYETYFTIASSAVPVVYVNSILMVEDTDYTYTTSVITFTGKDIGSGNVIEIYYQPDFFDDYANYIAAENLYATALVDTSNAVGKASYDAIKEKIREYKSMISYKPHVAKARDHRGSYGIF